MKIELPANRQDSALEVWTPADVGRYDLLCIEGLARALRIFLGQITAPQYTLTVPSVIQEVYVESSVSTLRNSGSLLG